MKYKVFNGVYWCLMSCLSTQDMAENACAMLREKYGKARIVKSGKYFLTYAPVIATVVDGKCLYTVVPTN